jgi:hypothetical protein
VCKALDQMIDASTPPDLVLDFTIGGPNSEVVQYRSIIYSHMFLLNFK